MTQYASLFPRSMTVVYIPTSAGWSHSFAYSATALCCYLGDNSAPSNPTIVLFPTLVGEFLFLFTACLFQPPLSGVLFSFWIGSGPSVGLLTITKTAVLAPAVFSG